MVHRTVKTRNYIVNTAKMRENALSLKNRTVELNTIDTPGMNGRLPNVKR